MIRKLAVVALVAVPLALLVAGCQRNEEPAPAEPVRPILSMVVESRSSPGIRLAGLVASQVQTNLGFRLAGRLASRSVNVGDRVSAGQIVAEIDAASLELTLRAAKADLVSAQAQFENAQGIEQRQRELLGSGNTTETSFELAELRLKLAQATLSRAQGNLRKAENQLGYAQLRAEFDGVVTAVDMDPGSDLMPGQPVLAIAKPDLRDAVIDVPESVASGLAIGTEFTVSLQLEPSISARGTLREIAPEADPAIRTRRIKIGLIEPPSAFRIGTTVSVASATGHASPIEVPLVAILEVDRRTYVWLVDIGTGTVSRHEVTIKDRAGDVAVLGSGLEAGMRIAVAGVHSLAEGQKIQTTGKDQ
jgi:RND family efflux transporter MFP subunit